MKKVICIIVVLFMLTGCSKATPNNKAAVTAEREFSRGIWLSFNEINSFLESTIGFKEEFSTVIENLKLLKITDLYFHIRSHCDSIVKSELFPMTEAAKSCDFDILQYVIDTCHKENIRVHAWINPYRVTASDSDTEKLSENSPVKKWLNDETTENDKNVVIYNGIYLNPAESDVRRLICDGVREIIDGYNIDGIHFDDYFYPTTDSNFDKVSYENYKNNTLFPMGLDNWRRANVDALIFDCKTAIEQSGKDIIFSVSPSADIENNYNTHYADIEYWCEKGLIDVVIPQLYFGFAHTDKSFNFNNLLKNWASLCGDSRTELKIGLATYKIGTQSATDGTEWAENSDIISRQTAVCLNNDAVSGVCYFSYSSLFSDNPPNIAERNNLINDCY